MTVLENESRDPGRKKNVPKNGPKNGPKNCPKNAPENAPDDRPKKRPRKAQFSIPENFTWTNFQLKILYIIFWTVFWDVFWDVFWSVFWDGHLRRFVGWFGVSAGGWAWLLVAGSVGWLVGNSVS